VNAIDDTDVEGSHTGTITHTSASEDSNFDGIVIEDMVVSIVDNDHGCGEPGQIYNQFDVSGPGGVSDCYVNLYDFVEFAGYWLDCTDLANPDCL